MTDVVNGTCSGDQYTYELYKRYGEGGCGTVFRAKRQDESNIVALKFQKADKASEVDQFIQEYKIHSKLTHKNICRVEGPCLSPADIDYPHKYKGKGASYAIESLPGGQLFDYISFSGAFDRQLTQHYMREICAGLNHMHSLSYAHRDLKPENLQLSEDFELKLIDFGFTANVFDSNFKWCGTEAYMSPQLIARTGKASDIFKDDIFALGVIFFIMAVGRPPFVEALKDDKYYKPLYKGLYSEFWEAQERMSGTSFDDDFKQLFTMMVQFDENARPSIQDIMQHPYMQESIYIEGGNSEIIAIMQDRRANMKVQAHENELSVQEGTRGIGEASTDDFNTDAILSQIDESKDRKDVKAADFEFIVEENHSFKSSISAHSIMVKFMTLFEADTQHRAQNEQEQKFFIKLDPETWSLNVTIKERIERAERDAELDSDDEADEAPARYNTSVLDVHVLQDDEDADMSVIYFQRQSGNQVQWCESEIRKEPIIIDIMLQE